jgi:hypothetical protein
LDQFPRKIGLQENATFIPEVDVVRKHRVLPVRVRDCWEPALIG